MGNDGEFLRLLFIQSSRTTIGVRGIRHKKLPIKHPLLEKLVFKSFG